MSDENIIEEEQIDTIERGEAEERTTAEDFGEPLES